MPLLLAALLPAMRAAAAEPDVDTSQVALQVLRIRRGFSATPNLGVGYVSEDSAKFGEYTGLDQQGAYVVADGDARYRDKDGLWLDLVRGGSRS